jgi:hypothetical protein
MEHTVLYVHLLGFSVWIGSFIAMIVCLTHLQRNELSQGVKQFYNRLQSTFTITGNAGALAMLVTGLILYSMTKTYTLSIYLTAAIGGGTCIFSIWAITFQSRRLSEKIKSNSPGKYLKLQITLMNISSFIVLAGILAVVGIASRK